MVKQAPFKPTDIGGCQLWLDAADATTVTGTTTVTQWRDKSVNARNLGVGSGTTSYANNAITLNSSYMFVTSAVNLSSVTVFIIAKTTGPSNQTVFVGRPNSSVNWNSLDGFGFWMDETSSIRFYGLATVEQSLTFGVNTSTPRLFSFQSSGTSISGWYQGVFQSSGTLSSTRTSTAQGFAIGAQWEGSSYGNISTNASLYEIIVYNSDVSNNQRQQVESYLAQKWGLQPTLSQGHPGTSGIVYPQTPLQNWVPWRYPTSFVPTQIQPGSCKLWLDAADSSATSMTFSSGNTLSLWKDKSGSNNNATAYNSPTLTQNAINGYQAISTFRSPYFRGSISITGTTYTLFTVATRSTGSFGTDTRLVSFAVNNSSADYNTTAASIGLFAQPAAQTLGTYRTSWIASNAYTMDTPFVASVTYTGTNGYMWFNGSNASYTGASSSGTFGITVYAIANQPSLTSEFWNGYIGEVIVYNTSLSTPDRQQVEGYLAWKWGLQANLPPTHLYKTAAPIITNPGGVSRPANVLPIPPITIYAGPRPVTGPVTSGLVNRWIFNNGSGSSVTDTVGGQNISLSGGYTWSSSVPNTAIAVKSLSLDGYSGVGSAAVNATLQTTTYSICLWYYHTGIESPTGGNPLMIETGLNQNEAFAIGTGGFTGTVQPYFYSSVYNGGFYRGFSAAVPLNTWTHLAVTIGNSKLTMYQNGTLDSANSNIAITSGLPLTLNDSLIFGKGDNAYGDQFGGNLFDVRIYNRALSAAEISQIYSGTG